jgi:hypothetical protein
MTQIPIACTLSPEALQARRNGLLTDLFDVPSTAS